MLAFAVKCTKMYYAGKRRRKVEQELALGVMLSGRNCFLTGAAGAGKTFVLNKFIAEARRLGKRVAVTASTGIAATHVNGNTVHSWSGIGRYDELPKQFFNKMSKMRKDEILRAEILVIDEISMLSNRQFDMVEEICRKVRGGERVFGGLQVIVCGDFFQLPPVSSGDETFAVESVAWKEADFAVLYLSGNYRQEDMEYLEILNSLRDGSYRRGQIEKLLSRVDIELSEEVTELYTHNIDVDKVNQKRLMAMEGEEHSYDYQHSGNARYYEKLAKNILAPETLRVKVGALVMAVKNMPEKGYHNGSTGFVVGYENGLPVVEFRNGKRITVGLATWELMDGETRRATVTQVPLRLAWAITIHKSQGMTLDGAKVDLSKAFEKGMGYVALSRVKTLDALSLVGINKVAISANEEVRKMDDRFREACASVAGECSELAQVGREVFERKHEEFSPKGRKRQLTAEEEMKKARWAAKVARERETFPNARMPWTIEESDTLIDEFLGGMSIGELSEKFGRKPRSIMMRLNVSFCAELFTREDFFDKP